MSDRETTNGGAAWAALSLVLVNKRLLSEDEWALIV